MGLFPAPTSNKKDSKKILKPSYSSKIDAVRPSGSKGGAKNQR